MYINENKNKKLNYLYEIYSCLVKQGLVLGNVLLPCKIT